MKWLFDFFNYWDAFFTGGKQYREDWNRWRLSPLEGNFVHGVSANEKIEGLDTSDIETENKRIEANLDSIFPVHDGPIDNVNVKVQDNTDKNVTTIKGCREVDMDEDVDTFVNRDILPNVDVQDSYRQLLTDCADIIKELDALNRQASGEEAKVITETIPHHLIEAIANGAVEIIDNVPEFDILLHSPMPVRPVVKGTPIKEYLRPGIRVGNKVFIRAIVRV